MNFVPVITHAVAILLGWLVVAFATLPNPIPDDPADDRPLSFRQGTRRSDPAPRPSPRSLLAGQASMPMDPAARTDLKRRILMDWATTDPDGLLHYLEDRPWLLGHENAADAALKTMALTRPDDLLDYARREGSQQAIGMLCYHGDPRIAIDRLLSLPPGVIHGDVLEDIIAEVFARGCQLDPTFHERFTLIENPATKLKVFEEGASNLLGDKRHDEFYSWVAKHVDAFPAEDIAFAISRPLVKSQSDLNDLKRLPGSIQPQALDSALQCMLGRTYIDESYQQASFTTYLENGWLDGRQGLAAAVITEYYQSGAGQDLGRTVATGWKEWALELPASPKWDSLRRTAIRRWILEDPDSWNAIANLPTKQLRNAAYAAVVHNLDLENDGERIPWILHQITDPALRNVALEVITARMEEDPEQSVAAADIDPFQPLGAR